MSFRLLVCGGALGASVLFAISCARRDRSPEAEWIGQGASAVVSPPFALADRAVGPSRGKPNVRGAAYGAGIFAAVEKDAAWALHRVDAQTGKSLDPLGIPLGAATDADVAFDGTSFRAFSVGGASFGLDSVGV